MPVKSSSVLESINISPSPIFEVKPACGRPLTRLLSLYRVAVEHSRRLPIFIIVPIRKNDNRGAIVVLGLVARD
jgi:hypothetical protein